nr:hypothetical protein [Tanacetum cinerariifolium]
MENTILELVEICRQKELFCMHDNVDDLIESALNSKLLSINLNSQRLDKKKQEVKNVLEQPAERGTHIIESLQNFKVIHKSSISLNNMSQISPVHAIAPILSTKEPEYSFHMGYEHLSTTPEMKLNEVTEFSAKNLLPIPSECEIDIVTETDDVLPPSVENDDDSEEDIHFLKELLNDNSIPLTKDESSDFDHQDDSSFPRPSPEPPDVEFDSEPDAGEEISAVMKNIDELKEDECFDPGGEIDVSTNN